MQKIRLFQAKIKLRSPKAGEKWYRFSTLKIRREITRGLGELYDIALAYSKNSTLDLGEQERWARLAAYIAQTINAIVTSYDAKEIKEIMKRVEEMVKRELREMDGEGAEGSGEDKGEEEEDRTSQRQG